MTDKQKFYAISESELQTLIDGYGWEYGFDYQDPDVLAATIRTRPVTWGIP